MSSRLLACALVLWSATASAQQPPPPAQPQPQPQPYPYPYPYPYQQPYPYQYAPPPPPPPREIPYDEMKPIPAGYKLEERARKGPIIAGSIVLGIPYVLGLWAAAAADFRNHSYWLVVPAIGPLLTLWTRDDACDEDGDGTADGDAGDCIGDAFLGTFLVLDALMQTAGGAVLVYGVASPKKVLVRQGAELTVGPRRVGSGHGFGISGTF